MLAWLWTPLVMTVQTDWHDYDNERLNKPLCQLYQSLIISSQVGMKLRSRIVVE